MVLTLVVPGMLWPRQVMRDTLYDVSLPALQTILGKGCRSPATASSVESWWSSYFAIREDDFSAAPLRLAALGGIPGTAHWMCADPVHLRIDQKGAALTDPALLNISAAEARQFHAALAPLFADFGDLVVTTPSHWHLQFTNSKLAPEFPDYLHRFIEQPAVALLPPGDESRVWRQLINEAQMILHSHPLNAERSAQGKATINSIAFWGAGYAPTPKATPTIELLGDDLMICGAASLAGMRTAPLPPHFVENKDDCIVYWDTLRFATAHHDALAWRDSLEQLERNWLAPALAALKRRELKRLDLYAFGDEEAFAVSLSLLDCWRFWRKPRRLEAL